MTRSRVPRVLVFFLVVWVAVYGVGVKQRLARAAEREATLARHGIGK